MPRSPGTSRRRGPGSSRRRCGRDSCLCVRRTARSRRSARAPTSSIGYGASATWPRARARQRSATPRTTIRSVSIELEHPVAGGAGPVSRGKREGGPRALRRARAGGGRRWRSRCSTSPTSNGRPGTCRRASRHSSGPSPSTPGDTTTLSLLGAYLTQAGRAGEAVALLSGPAQRPEPDPEVLRSLALALGRLGRGKEAVATLTRAREVDPQNVQLLVDLGTIRLMAGEAGPAREAFEAALGPEPRRRAGPQLARVHGRADGRRRARARAPARRPSPSTARECETAARAGVAVASRRRGAAAARPYLELFVESAARTPCAASEGPARGWLAGGSPR